MTTPFRFKNTLATSLIVALLLFCATLGGFMNFDHQIDDIAFAYKGEEPHLIAHFSTYYGESSANRKSNVELASRKIDGCVLFPEEEFSFNDIVGKRSEANGFKSAYIIQDGEYIEGVGGGVCQVSTTLYNCALLAGLAISQVRAHSLQVSYVMPSFDAMVSSASDFCFVNTQSAPISIKMKTDGKYVRAEIYGVDDVCIRRVSKSLETIPHDVEYREDETLELGEQKIDTYGHDGLKSQGYLEYFKDGKLVESVLIRNDCYKPQKRIVLINSTKTTY